MFFNLFKKKNKIEDMEFPYKYESVSGKDALSHCLRVRNNRSEGIPVILGNLESIHLIVENISYNEDSVEHIIEQSKQFDFESYKQMRIDDDPELFENMSGEWPDEVEPSQLMAVLDILTGKPLKEVLIGYIPAQYSYEIPAFLKYGCWNYCPEAAEHVAIMRKWQEVYGAEIISMTSDTIECIVSQPPQTKEEALLLANEQAIYCPDIVLQGVESIEALAATLLNNKLWYFWWD